MHIGFLAGFHGISRTQSFLENRLENFQVRVVLKPLVSLISHLIACSARISADTQTDRQTDKPTTVTLAAHARRGLIIQTLSSRTTVSPARPETEGALPRGLGGVD